ncbi:MAG: hypothetical protein U0359_39205 [Byssovorax sp.]
MATKVKLKPLNLTDPQWDKAEAKPGDEVELSVTAKGLEAGQTVEIRIRDKNGNMAILTKLTASGDQQKVKWVVPNTFDDGDLVFDAILREKPTPKNGHVTSRGKVSSPKLRVHGFSVSIKSIDNAFCPKQEKLHASIHVANKGNVALKGRYEIWGERYPSGKPLYTEDFNPAAGDTPWNTWDGKANAGTLSGKYISPEFSPYRLRVMIGLDAAALNDPHGAGRGKVSIAEHGFEVRFESLSLRVQAGLPAAVTGKLDSLFKIEPRQPNGTYADKGRLPKDTEIGRIRVPNARHIMIGEALNQGMSNAAPLGWQHRLADNYMDNDDAPPVGGGARGKTKHAIDTPIYTRPELPIEIEPKLRSRDGAKNTSHHGIFEKEAVGPAHFEVLAEDVYEEALYTPATPEAAYLLAAATKVKRGAHYAPQKSGVNPIIDHWQQRFKVASDGDREFSTTEAFVVGSNELSVYLNRAKLTLGANADYTEVNTKKIKLAEHLSKKDDILWVIRVPAAAIPALPAPPAGEAAPAAVARWAAFPPGDNCHEHYGGVRGKSPNPNLLDDFSAAPAGTEPILGKGGAFPYKGSIEKNPDGDPNGGERFEAIALGSGANQGLAGFLFSPSTIGGDSYVLEAAVRAAPYERSMGEVPGKPKAKARTGKMSVWRMAQITLSSKLPAKGTNGLPGTVGIDDPAVGGRTHPGDGVGMMVSTLNTMCEHAYVEWETPVPAAAPVANEPHQDVVLATYLGLHNGRNGALGLVGFPALAGAANVTNDLVQWDPYRDFLPPGIPANRVNVASNAVAGVAVGADGRTAALAVLAAINAHNNAINPVTGAAWGPARPDAALAGGVAAIAVRPGTVASYFNWVSNTVDKVAYAYLDGLTPRIGTGRTMQTLRWPNYHKIVWKNGNPAGMQIDSISTAGFCRGSGQSYFATDPNAGNPDTFEHEMGHSLHLVHFITGWATNSAWKHHDQGYPSCKMGYYNAPRPVGGVPQFYSPPLPAGGVGPAIQLNTGNRNLFCAKCLLKMRGWDELVLPCNWTHPDVF